ncbi:MAG: hypothetical protein ACTSO9_07295 [Candidatus Helarchaeota archaeon]
MDKDKYYKNLFIFGAFWNIFVAVSCILASIILFDISILFGMATPPSLMWLHMYFIYVLIFGIGFYIVSKDITKNQGVIIIGVLEKLSVFIIALIYCIIGHINVLGVLLVSVDLVFAFLFLEFLINFEGN